MSRDTTEKYSAINFAKKFELFNDHWSPRVVAGLNNYQFKLAKIKDEFVWHQHTDTDEAFIVIKGSMRIYFRDGHCDLNAGEMFVVPKGVEHKPVATEECQILLIEPEGVVNTADVESNLTYSNDVWI